MDLTKEEIVANDGDGDCESSDRASELRIGDPEYHRSDAEAWVEVVSETYGGKMSIPPPYMVLHTDLLYGAGWKRLVPYNAAYVRWPVFKQYLEAYFTQDADSTPCVEQTDKTDALPAAANLCLQKENMLLRNCLGGLATDDVKLIIKIRDRAKKLIESEGHRSCTATVGLECIAGEAELMFNLLGCEFDTTEMIATSNMIRRSALNLMLSGSSAAAGAMMGINKEAKILLDLMNQTDRLVYVQYNTCDTIRQKTASVLTMLEQEFACETDADNPMGVSSVTDMDMDGHSKQSHGGKEELMIAKVICRGGTEG